MLYTDLNLHLDNSVTYINTQSCYANWIVLIKFIWINSDFRTWIHLVSGNHKCTSVLTSMLARGKKYKILDIRFKLTLLISFSIILIIHIYSSFLAFLNYTRGSCSMRFLIKVEKKSNIIYIDSLMFFSL